MVLDYPDWQRGIRLVGADITLNVNIEAQVANLNFNFADQSVAVFDAAKWFAHEAEQVFNTGTDSASEGTWKTIVSYTVPTDKNYFIVGVAYSVIGGDGEVYNTHLRLYIGGVVVFRLGGHVGGALPLDTPLRATAGQGIQIDMEYWAASASATMTASFWGYKEDE